ncbi:MAG: cobaltochelatase subunit CobN, partial [Euryarchaeota archaeon]|nr:cobaltochelatase subunit CobN [Euryarchaeota archaeon]
MRWDRSRGIGFAMIAALLLLAAPPLVPAQPDSEPAVIFLLGAAPSPKFVDAVKDCDYLKSDIYLIENLPDDIDLTSYDLVFIDWLWKMTPNLERLTSLIDLAKADDVTVIVRKTYYIAPPEEIGNVDPGEHPWIGEYWENINDENARNLLIYLGANFLGLAGVPEEPVTLPHEGIYHPDAERVFGDLGSYLEWYDYDPDKPTIGILFHETNYIKRGPDVEDSLIRAFEERGVNVVAYYYPHSGRPDLDNFLI